MFQAGAQERQALAENVEANSAWGQLPNWACEANLAMPRADPAKAAYLASENSKRLSPLSCIALKRSFSV